MGLSRSAGTLAEPERLAERVAALGAGHMAPLNRLVAELRAEHEAVPSFDPFDGGVGARLLILLESPGPGPRQARFVSRDNPTGTGANLRRFLGEAGIAREDSLIWNAVPWIIHAPGARNRAPRRGEVKAGLARLPALLALLPRLRVLILAGRVAGEAAGVVRSVLPGLRIILMPHPSPANLCTSPAVPARMAAALAEARQLLMED